MQQCPVEGGDRVASRISQWLASVDVPYEVVIATMDWHPPAGGPEPFAHFSETPDYVATWPPHCVRGTVGAALHPDLELPRGTVVVCKGQAAAAYSGFEGHDEHEVSLAEILQRAGIDAVDVVGLATSQAWPPNRQHVRSTTCVLPGSPSCSGAAP
jgi:nicotinamidase/pyrazinamidase